MDSPPLSSVYTSSFLKDDLSDEPGTGDPVHLYPLARDRLIAHLLHGFGSTVTRRGPHYGCASTRIGALRWGRAVKLSKPGSSRRRSRRWRRPRRRRQPPTVTGSSANAA